MADIFTRDDARRLLSNKKIWFFGDSNMRGLYKDLIWLLEKNSLIKLSSLRGKKLQTAIEFTFLTQCMSSDIQERLKLVKKDNDVPDVILLNSCLWDITRWGPESVEKYKGNVVDLLRLLKDCLGPETRVIWITTPPVSNEPHGGFFIKQIEFLKHTLRFDVMEANTFVSRAVVQSGFDVLDIHYHLLLQIHRRGPDGIHWTPEALRHITNLFLTHLCVSWDSPLPGNFKSPLLEKLYRGLATSKKADPWTGDPAIPASNPVGEQKKSMENHRVKTRGRKRDHNWNFAAGPSHECGRKRFRFDGGVKKIGDFVLQNMVLHRYKLSTYGATKRLTGIDENLVDPILFTEKLYVFDENGKRIGMFSMNIDLDGGASDGRKILLVHISNKAFVGGRLSESIVTGSITPKLKTLEEIRYECTEVSASKKHERCTFLLRETTKYYVSVTNTICGLTNQTRHTIPFVDALGLIGESANAVLLRKLATKGYEGILSLRTVLPNGRRCRNYYVSKLCDQVINGKKMQVMIIYRNITNHRKYNVTMTLALTRAGQLLYLFWSNSKCFLHVDPDLEVDTNRVTYGRPKLYRRWHGDIQLHSIYLDRVDRQEVLYRSYKYQREPLRRVLDDFIEHLLFLKPDNVICFAIQYFAAFGHNTMRKCRSIPKFPAGPFEEGPPVPTTVETEDNFWSGEQ